MSNEVLDQTFENLKKASQARSLTELDALIQQCTVCEIGKCRKNAVVSNQKVRKDLMIVGEAPGENEDQDGEPFTGKSGQLMFSALAKLGITRDDVYLCNVLKCRPPGNRAPEPDEVSRCTPWLYKQIDLVKPKVIVTVGKYSLASLLPETFLAKPMPTMGKIRGKELKYEGIRLMPTWHPAYLLRNPNAQIDFWQDLQVVKSWLN